MDLKKIGERLRLLRGDKSIKEVSLKLGVSVSALAMYESGKRIPRDEMKLKIANLYCKTVSEIFFDE